MMNKLTMIVMAFLLLFAGCDEKEESKNETQNKEEQQPAETVLDISSMTLALDNDGNAKTFSIVSNGEWTITNNSSWCKVDKTYGKGNAVVSVMAFPYEEYDDRSVNLTVKSGTKTKVLAVTQKKKDALLLTEEKYTLEQEGGTIAVEVKSNLSYSVTIPSAHQEWIKEVSRQATKGLTTTNKYFEIAPNTNAASREGIIVFKDNDSSLADTVRVFQARYGKLILLQDRYTIGYSTQTLSVELQTNVDYEVIIPDTVSSWISQSASPSVGKADVIRLDIAANPTKSERKGEVIVADRNGTLSDTLYITQESNVWKGKEHYVPGLENTVYSYHLGFYNFNSTDYEVIIPDTVQWIQYNARNKSWNVASNTTGHHREAFIMIRNKNTQARDTSRICQCIKPFNSIEIVKSNGNILYEEISASMNIKMPRDANRIRIPRTDGIKWSRVLEEGTERNVKIEETGAYIECYDFSGSFKLNFRFECDHEYDDETKCKVYTTATFIRDMESELIYNYNITFTSVEEIKEFVVQGYNNVKGTMTIEINDPDFTDLSAFANHQIKKINTLTIKCPNLKSFQGIAGLEEIHTFNLTGNYPYLVSFSGLETLGSLNALNIGNDGNTFRYLTTFQGLNGIKKLNGLQLYGNFPSLKSFEGLENVTEIDGYDGYYSKGIHLNGTFNSLSTFQGLNNLENINSFGIISKSTALASFQGLEKLTTIKNSFVISGLFKHLINFKGLENLRNIGGDFILSTHQQPQHYNNLKNFSGLEKLEYIGGSFEIQGDLPMLKSFEGLSNLKKIGTDLVLGGYSGYCTTPPKFSGETLDGLNHLTSVGGNVSIYDCSKLTTLEGLNSLSYIGGEVSINKCLKLVSLNGLNNLKTVEETIKIVNCPELLSINGLGALQTFPNALNGAKVLKIRNCSKLKNFCGLSEEFLRYYDLEVSGCSYNPTREDLLNGNCSQ